MTIEIKISDMRLVINRILDHIEHDLGLTAVKLSQDSYWEVSYNQRYDFTKTPTDYDHGQLYDDWEFLTSILKDNDQAVSLMLIHAAPLVRWLGEKVGQ
jgi:hypothetical protein